MKRWPRNWGSGLLGTLLLGGCCYAVREQADHQVCDIAAQALDAGTAATLEPPPAPEPPSHSALTTAAAPEPLTRTGLNRAGEPPTPREATQQPGPGGAPPSSGRPEKLLERLKVPVEIPGAGVPPIQLPPRTAPEAERQAALTKLLPPLAPLGPDPQPGPGPDGHPWTLAELQKLAMSNSPLLRQAAADVEAAKGTALQAGAYPNPSFGYQVDTFGTGSTAGFEGIFFEQVIKAGGKLKLAQAAALMDLENSKLALRRAQTDLMTQVRTNYFAVLTAREALKVTRALAQYSERLYGIQIDLIQGGEVPPYQAQLQRVIVVQLRGSLVQARNRYVAAWKQLAAGLGLPGLPPTELAGRLDLPLPVFRYDQALARVLSRHTDVLNAQNGIQKAHYNLRAAQVTPVPDVSLHVAIEKDFTTPPFTVVGSVQMGVPVPVWDQNKGNTMQAQGALLRAVEQEHQVRDDLTNRLATAYEQYENNRVLLEYYRNSILKDQVPGFVGVLNQFLAPNQPTGYVDILTTEQTLVSVITTYSTTLGSAWSAAVSVADLLQTDDLYELGPEAAGTQGVAPVPDLEHLAPLPCCHPCTPAPDPALKGGEGSWPLEGPDNVGRK